MYQYTFDNETTKKLNNSTSSAKSIFEKFDDVDIRYGNLTNTNGNLSLEKMEFNKPTNDEIERQAKTSLEAYKNSSINSINDSYNQKTENLQKDINVAKEQNEKQIDQIKSNYSLAKQEAKDDAIKRGLARSSIIVNTLSSLDNGMIRAFNEKVTELNNTLSGYENQKSVLEAQKNTALNNFDIEYAVKLQDKINSINSDIEKKSKEVLEYNNKIEETVAKWEKDKQQEQYDRTIEMAKLMSENGITMFEVLKQNEKYELAKAHFSTMPKDDAINELKNNTDYQKHLGSAFYNKLLKDLEK